MELSDKRGRERLKKRFMDIIRENIEIIKIRKEDIIIKGNRKVLYVVVTIVYIKLLYKYICNKINIYIKYIN